MYPFVSLLFNVDVSANLLIFFLATDIVKTYFVIVSIESITMTSSLNVDVSANLLRDLAVFAFW